MCKIIDYLERERERLGSGSAGIISILFTYLCNGSLVITTNRNLFQNLKNTK